MSGWNIRCECGLAISADSKADLVLAAERHVEAAHPRLAGAALPDWLAMALPAREILPKPEE